jgi:signal transduction histidine kinase
METDILIAVILVFFIIILVASSFVILLRVHIKKEKVHQEELRDKEREKHEDINSTIIDTQEETLNNIAKELHDDAGQQLTYINFQLENLHLEHPDFAAELNPIRESVSNLAYSIRELSHSIDNKKFNNYQLIENIQKEVDKLNDLKTMEAKLIVSENFEHEFSTNENIILFRILQEIINNALKHSMADNFTVEITKNPEVRINIQDDGIGFSMEKINLETSGLQNIKDRAQLINFEASIESEPGKGTKTVIQQLPKSINIPEDE